MKLMIGLGNPGIQYEGTRHNIGRALVENLAADCGLDFTKDRRRHCEIARWRSEEGTEIVLAYPEVFMNHSGKAVRALVEAFEPANPSEILILVDDVALPFGRLRLRPRGSSGGHNGLKSVEQALGTQDYARLRLGVGLAQETSTDRALEDYVLDPFTGEEQKALPGFLERGRQACRLWVRDSIEDVMNVVNALE